MRYVRGMKSRPYVMGTVRNTWTHRGHFRDEESSAFAPLVMPRKMSES